MRMLIKWWKQKRQGQRDPTSPQRMLSWPRVDSHCCHHPRQQCYFTSWERHLGSLSPNSHLTPGYCWQCSSRKNPATATGNPWEQKPACGQFTCLMRAGWASFACVLYKETHAILHFKDRSRNINLFSMSEKKENIVSVHLLYFPPRKKTLKKNLLRRQPVFLWNTIVVRTIKT